MYPALVLLLLATLRHAPTVARVIQRMKPLDTRFEDAPQLRPITARATSMRSVLRYDPRMEDHCKNGYRTVIFTEEESVNCHQRCDDDPVCMFYSVWYANQTRFCKHTLSCWSPASRQVDQGASIKTMRNVSGLYKLESARANCETMLDALACGSGTVSALPVPTSAFSRPAANTTGGTKYLVYRGEGRGLCATGQNASTGLSTSTDHDCQDICTKSPTCRYYSTWVHHDKRYCHFASRCMYMHNTALSMTIYKKQEWTVPLSAMGHDPNISFVRLERAGRGKICQRVASSFNDRVRSIEGCRARCEKDVACIYYSVYNMPRGLYCRLTPRCQMLQSTVDTTSAVWYKRFRSASSLVADAKGLAARVHEEAKRLSDHARRLQAEEDNVRLLNRSLFSSVAAIKEYARLGKVEGLMGDVSENTEVVAAKDEAKLVEHSVDATRSETSAKTARLQACRDKLHLIEDTSTRLLAYNMQKVNASTRLVFETVSQRMRAAGHALQETAAHSQADFVPTSLRQLVENVTHTLEPQIYSIESACNTSASTIERSVHELLLQFEASRRVVVFAMGNATNRIDSLSRHGSDAPRGPSGPQRNSSGHALSLAPPELEFDTEDYRGFWKHLTNPRQSRTADTAVQEQPVEWPPHGSQTLQHIATKDIEDAESWLRSLNRTMTVVGGKVNSLIVRSVAIVAKDMTNEFENLCSDAMASFDAWSADMQERLETSRICSHSSVDNLKADVAAKSITDPLNNALTAMTSAMRDFQALADALHRLLREFATDR